MKKVIYFLILCIHIPSLSEGFAASTLIQTPQGLQAIKDLSIGQEIIGYDFVNQQLRIQTVVHISKNNVSQCCQLTIENKGNILTHLDQQFYIRNVGWLQSSALEKYANISFLCFAFVSDMQFIDNSIELYVITTEPDHNFFIEDNVLVHNMVPFVVMAGPIIVPTLTKAAVFVGAGIASWLGYIAISHTMDVRRKKFNSSKRDELFHPVNNNRFPSPEYPNGEEFKRKHPYGKYEDAPYHHPNARGVKSSSPKNGQAALDNSFEVKTKGNYRYQRRVGISNEQFVVLDETGNNVFHGHIRGWKELTKEMKDILIEAKLVTTKGKIL